MEGPLNSESIQHIATAIGAVVTAIVGFGQFLAYRSRRDKLSLVRDSFNRVVEALASDVEVERLAGAILLRRFFDPRTEVGIAGAISLWRRRLVDRPTERVTADTPYANEALNVIASMLRSQPSGNLQKLLADGLAYAPTLQRADLQRTNLQRAYLGARKRANSDKVSRADLSHADFYRADLSGASLRGAVCEHAAFYQARLNGTILKDANLRCANFFEADLQGSVFTGADLQDADFTSARNVPSDIAKHLDAKGVYQGRKKHDPNEHPTAESAVVVSRPRVFVSRPGWSDEIVGTQIAAICSRLEREGLEPVTPSRDDYPVAGALAEAKRVIGGCAGAVILGFPDVRVEAGAWRPGTPEEAELKGKSFATTWSQVEAGMALMAGLPVLVMGDDVIGGVFDEKTSEHGLVRIRMDMTSPRIADWCAAVSEQTRQRK